MKRLLIITTLCYVSIFLVAEEEIRRVKVPGYELSKSFYSLVDSVKLFKPLKKSISEDDYMVEFHCASISDTICAGVVYKIHKYSPNDKLLNGVCTYGKDTIYVYGSDGLKNIFIPQSDSIEITVCRQTFYTNSDTISCYCDKSMYDPIAVIPYNLVVPCFVNSPIDRADKN